MNRRGFLGALGIGAAAGPKLAGGIVRDGGGVPPLHSYLSNGFSVVESSDSDWRIKRIRALKQIIADGDPEFENGIRINKLLKLEEMERYRLDSLRSVSSSHKSRMLIDGSVERQRRINRADAEYNLWRLLKGDT